MSLALVLILLGQWQPGLLVYMCGGGLRMLALGLGKQYKSPYITRAPGKPPRAVGLDSTTRPRAVAEEKKMCQEP